MNASSRQQQHLLGVRCQILRYFLYGHQTRSRPCSTDQIGLVHVTGAETVPQLYCCNDFSMRIELGHIQEAAIRTCTSFSNSFELILRILRIVFG